MKDLPKVFANEFDKSHSNNRSYSYGKLEEQKNVQDFQVVSQKIDKIFKSETTLYSIDCIISYENSSEKCTIIGKTSNNLVTKNQRVIPIKDIYDIELA